MAICTTKATTKATPIKMRSSAELRGREDLRFVRLVSELLVAGRDMVLLVIFKFSLAFDFPGSGAVNRVRSHMYKIKISTA
jgi:hypothetical protein